MSNSIVLRLRFYAGQTVATFHRWIYAEAADFIESQADRIAKLEAALSSIARNTCCDKCQEAALVARAALSGGKDGT